MLPLTFPLKLQAIVVILSFGIQQLNSECPIIACECKWTSGKESVICINANLSSVPLHLDAGTQLLDLTSNNLITVKQDEFSNANLLNLQKIYISKCRLKSLDRYAFRNLINLVELDLSYNALSTVPSHIFESIPELRELKLSGNPIQRIMNEAFVNTRQLMRLELSECKIGTIEIKAFYGLERSLEWLRLDNNKLTEVKAQSFTIFQNLHELDVSVNPWNCSCTLRPLREWMLHQNVPFSVPPVCRYPTRLATKSWDKLELDEFACVPEIIALDPKAHGVEGKNVTLTCRIAGIPEPSVKWLSKNKVIANLSSAAYSNGKKSYMVHSQNNSSDLTILTAEVQDAGIYVCAAENKAGKSEASVTLAVSRKPPEASLSKKVLIASTLAGIFLVLISCSVVLCVCTVRRKRILKWRKRNYRREDNYEKIEMNHKIAGERVQSDLRKESGTTRNGDYRLIPGAEIEQASSKEEETFEIGGNDFITPQNAEAVITNERWNSPELPLLDTEDLHIPRRSHKTRDDRKKSSHLEYGIYSDSFGSLNSAQSVEKVPTGAAYTTSTSTELPNLQEDNTGRKYPDLIENRSSTQRGSLRSISEGNSASDISDLYCTLPRKHYVRRKEQLKYCSTDSQFPLLEDSRYSSSGGESCSSQTSSKRFPDHGSQPTHKSNQRCSSYLNLIHTKSGSPVTENHPQNATPLLNVSTLANSVSYRRNVISPLPIDITSSYDYHAAQLERFLEEYRNLQKELTKMKETCESLSREKTPTSTVACNNFSPESSTSRLSSVQSSSVVSPNLVKTLDGSLSTFENELSKILYSSNSSPRAFTTGDIFND